MGISKLLRFTSTKSEEKDISLDKYLDRMQESQESIYYMSGESLEVMKKAPALQVFTKKDIEVLLLDVTLDEPDEEKKRFSKLKDMYKPLTDWWKEKLTD